MTENSTVRPETKLIVVGVDDSEGSADALRWAVREAKLRDAKVRAVFAWGYPVYTGLEGAAFYLDPVELERNAVTLLNAAVQSACAPEDAAAVEQVTTTGTPVDALVEQSKAADLVVIGARGKGGFLGLRLGSVSTQVSHHAHCPIVIIRHES